MPAHWKTIAKNQLRLLTSRVRKFRAGFFIIVTTLLCLWAFFVAPNMASSAVPEIRALGTSLLPTIAGLVDFIFLIGFAIIIMYQLISTFQTMGEGQYELLIATPIKAGEIFLGEYLGKMVIYLWVILFIVPPIAILLQGLFGISALGIAVITLIVFGLVAVASWVGAIVTGYAVKKLGKSARGKDIGRALAIVLGMVFMLAYFGLTYIGLSALTNPTLRTWLQISPSSWFANLLNAIIGAPLPLPAFGWELSLLAVSIFSLALFFGGYRLAPHFYSLDMASTQGTTSIVKESGYFHFLRWILPQQWKGIVVTQMKNFLRRKENIAKLVYLVFFVLFISVIGNFGLGTIGTNTAGSSGPVTSSFSIAFTILLFGMLAGVQLGSFIFVNSKDILWIFKQSPRDIKALVLGSWIAMLMLIIPIAAGTCIFVALTSNMDVVQGILFFSILLLSSAGALAMAMGIGSINPAYQQRSSKMLINSLLFMGLQFLIFVPILTASSVIYFFASLSAATFAFFTATLIAIGNCIVGPVILSLGIWKLGKME